jgi:hypothetical protein
MPPAQSACDAICQASQLGRLDLISALLAAIAILLALGGIYAFVNIRSSARQVAREAAEAESRQLAEAAAVAYLERELPRLVASYRELARNAVADGEANAVAETQENET